jgi:general secretion pathway protein J
MAGSGPDKTSSGGFTLVELLIAFTIVALIMGILVGAMRLGIRSWEKGHERVNEYQRLRATTEQIAEDIRSAFQADGKKVTSFLGDSDKLTFHTATRGLRPQSNRYGTRRVSYYVDEDGRLVLEETYPFDEKVKGGTKAILYDGAEKIAFRYYQTRVNKQGWVNRWDSKEQRKLPGAVEITLTLVGDKGETIELPPFVVPIFARRILSTSAIAVRGTPFHGGLRK